MDDEPTKQQQHLALKRLLKALPAYIRELWQQCLARDHEQMNYRDVLIKEGEHRQFGYILLSGSVTLTRTSRSNSTIRRRMLAEVTGLDILGSDCVFDHEHIHFYTYTVSSSTAECIRVSTDEIMELAVLLNIQSIREREMRRRAELTRDDLRNTQSVKRFAQKQSQLELLKMQLPQIKPKKHSPRRSTRSVKADKPILFDEIITLPKQHLKILNRTPQKSQPINQSPDRLFKQNLKNIIRRKISYETREFAVLKFFRKAELNGDKLAQTINNPEPQHIVEGPINRFFNLEVIQ